MAIRFHRDVSRLGVRTPVIAANNEVFAVGSPVTVNSSGFLAVASSSGEKIWGFSLEAVTAISTNQNGTSPQTRDSAAVGYAPKIQHWEGVTMQCLADQALTQTDIGAYVDIASVAAGVPTLNLAAGATGQFYVVGLASDFHPSAATNDILVTVAEPQDYGFAQS